jgi:hypothetical protein
MAKIRAGDRDDRIRFVVPDRRRLAALKPIVNRIGISVYHRLTSTCAAPAFVGKSFRAFSMIAESVLGFTR